MGLVYIPHPAFHVISPPLLTHAGCLSKPLRSCVLTRASGSPTRQVKGDISVAGLADSGPGYWKDPESQMVRSSGSESDSLGNITESVMNQVPSQMWGLAWILGPQSPKATGIKDPCLRSLK